MVRYLLSFVICFQFSCIAFSQITFTAVTTPSTCNTNGSITISASGGTSPYIYQIISSTVGILRPAQNTPVFNNLPNSTYTIRVTDASNLTTTGDVIVYGNYTPLSFTYTQQQSKIIIQPLNGRKPYTFSYSSDGGNTYSPPVDSGYFHCMSPGIYVFRVYDSCTNFYSETVVVDSVKMSASFSCINNNSAIQLNSISNGNGNYSFHAYGSNYNQTNTIGNFTGISRCSNDIIVEVTDKCNLKDKFNGCVAPLYSYKINCVNFKDKSLTLSPISGGNGIPYQINVNGIITNATYIQNIPIVNGEIIVNLTDSCGRMKADTIKPFTTVVGGDDYCESGKLTLSSFYKINNENVSFPPTRYTSISGPSSFTYVDSTRNDSSVVLLENLQFGTYVYKVTNACGDEITNTFTYNKKCFRKVSIEKKQTCTQLFVKLYRDCEADSNALFTLMDENSVIISQNSDGMFSGLNNDLCYKIAVKLLDCDTTIFDNINPLKPKIRIFQNACNELNIATGIQVRRICGTSTSSSYIGLYTFILADSNFNILYSGSNGNINTVPPNTYWVYAISDDCNSDTLRYDKQNGFTDTIQFCLSPSVRYVNNRCRFAWQVSMENNIKNINYHLVGNGIDIVSNKDFIGIDTGRYILKDGCNEQEIYLPNYYDFKTILNPGCPANSKITATYSINSTYIYDLGMRYFFKICNEPIFDFNLKEIGSNAPLVNSTTGEFTNLKNGTYYAVLYKGNEVCNYFSDTVFTPYYTRPSLTATYGLICNGNNATVKTTVIGGSKPYTFEVLNSGLPAITTDSNFVFYNNLPLGIANFRVSDACGISANYSTEVLSIDFDVSYKRKCDGTLQLIAPDIFNASYIWTNKLNDTISKLPTVYTTINSDDTFQVAIQHLSCTINKSLTVQNFSTSSASANASFDFKTDTSFTNLHGNTPPANTIGTWKQIDPSSGITIFENENDPNTKATVDVFPGIYTYVWTIQDTLIGCLAEDTVIVSYLRCPTIIPILYTKKITPGSCGSGASIEFTITQSSSPVHFLWNNGDTSSLLSNLADNMYVVFIHDESNCTPDIFDTTYLILKSNSGSTINSSFCVGDSIVINGKQYKTAGTYSDTLLNSLGCDSILTIQISTLERSLTYDTLNYCQGERITLPDSQIITTSGNYQLKLTNSVGCDSLKNYTINFRPSIQKTVDTMICSGSTYQLPGGIIVSLTNSYTDSLKTSLGCDSIIITKLKIKDSLKNVFIGNDTIICADENFSIQLNYPSYVNYLWNDISILSMYTIKDAGLYYVRVSDGCAVTHDTIQVETKDCTCNFYIPTAFSPNSDNKNDLFIPFILCEMYSSYSFSVFNRWGENVFSTNDENTGWDGNYKNTIQPTDTYVWVLSYFDIKRNKEIVNKGIVTLLR